MFLIIIINNSIGLSEFFILIRIDLKIAIFILVKQWVQPPTPYTLY